MKSLHKLVIMCLVFFMFGQQLKGQFIRSYTDPCDFVESAHLYHSPFYSSFRQLLNLPDPESVPRLPLSHGENFPIEYYLHKSIPEQNRSVFYNTFSEWNTRVGFRMFVVKGIDYGDIHLIDNRRDQRNVIYWFNEEEWNRMYTQYNAGSEESPLSNLSDLLTAVALPMLHLDNIDDSSSYLLISDVDLIIREEFTTNVQVIRWQFMQRLQYLGLQPPMDADVEYLQSMLVQYLSNMSPESFRDLMIQQMQDVGIDPSSYTDRVAFFENIRKETIRDYSLDLSTESLSNSDYLRNTVLHELGHAIGLGHSDNEDSLMYSGYANEVSRYILTPKYIDSGTIYKLSCIYNLEYLRQAHPL